MSLPNDLVPLPTMPYDERPVALPLDREECRTAIWRARGNLTDAAKILKVPSLRLRTYVKNSPYLSAEVQEANEQLVDVAEGNVYEALTDDDDKGRKDSMTRFVLASQGRSRGWGQGQGGGSVKIATPNGRMMISWGDGSSFGNDDNGDNAKVIEGKAE